VVVVGLCEHSNQTDRFPRRRAEDDEDDE